MGDGLWVLSCVAILLYGCLCVGSEGLIEAWDLIEYPSFGSWPKAKYSGFFSCNGGSWTVGLS